MSDYIQITPVKNEHDTIEDMIKSIINQKKTSILQYNQWGK